MTKAPLSLTSSTLSNVLTTTTTSGAYDNSFHILQEPVFWSTAIVLSIVGLLYLWEQGVVTARRTLPSTLLPVLDSILAEMSGLGFIGLFLGVVVTDGPVGTLVAQTSATFLHDENILLETFEVLHEIFFKVGVAFFMVAGLTVLTVLKKIGALTTVSTALFDQNSDGVVSVDELADVLGINDIPVDVNLDGNVSEEEIRLVMESIRVPTVWDELRLTPEQTRAEALVVRERFVNTAQVEPNFRIESYFGRVFGLNLKEVVELSPLIWLPLLPALSLGRSIDLSRDIVSASSSNAFDSCGYFLGTTDFFAVVSLYVLVAAVWGYYNYWKTTAVKNMLIPILVRDTNGQTLMLPPRYENPKLLADFNASPAIFGWIESFLRDPPRNNHESVFGVVGAAFPETFATSLKFQTWLVVVQLVLTLSEIVFRDVDALLRGASSVGNPELLVPELAVFSLFVLLGLSNLWLVPRTFLNYSIATSIEMLMSDEAIEQCGNEASPNLPIVVKTNTAKAEQRGDLTKCFKKNNPSIYEEK